jgi:O-antigen ligase
MEQDYSTDLYFPEQDAYQPLLMESVPVGKDKIGIIDWIFALYLTATAGTTSTPYWYIPAYLGYFAMFIFIFSLNYGGVSRNPGFWLVAALILWTWITTAMSDYTAGSTVGAWYHTKINVAGLMFMGRCTSYRKFIFFLKSMVIGVAILAIAGAIMGYSSATEGRETVETGIGGQRNAYGAVLFAGVVAGQIIFPVVSKKWKMFIWIYFAAVAVTLLASGSRGATVSCCVIFLSYYILEHVRYIGKNLKIIIPATIIVMGTPFLIIKLFPHAILVERMLEIVYSGVEEGSSGRTDIIRHAWGLFLDHPFWGVGTGMYIAYSPVGYVYTHTTYLEFLVASGVPGFLFYYSFFLFIWIMLTRLVKIYKTEDHYRKLFNAGRAALLANIAYGSFYLMHTQKVVVFVFACIIGFCVPLWRQEKQLMAEEYEL